MILADTGDVPEIQPPMPWDLIPMPYLIAAVVVLLLLAMVAGLLQSGGAPRGVPRQVRGDLSTRARRRLHPGPGWASGRQYRRHLSPRSARRVAHIARPSLTWWQLHQPGGWDAYATHLGNAWGWVRQRPVVAGPEDVTLVFAGPRRGKSAGAATRIIDAPGKVVATSVRDDSVKHTIGPRSQKGRVFTLNLEGLGSYGSTLRWNPVWGCEDPQVSGRRAGRMVESVEQRGLSDADFWSDQCSMVLAGYMHAAALAGYTMMEVYSWSSGADDTPLRILSQAKGAHSAHREDIEHFLDHMPDRTQSSVVTTLRRVLKFMSHPSIPAMLAPHPDPRIEESLPEWFDARDFVSGEGCDTLYLISSAEEPLTRPLLSALLAEISHEIRYASAAAGGRLDPPLDLELDEVANIAPVPLDQWASWMGGCGVRIRAYAQSWAQLVKTFGPMGAESIWACASKILVHGGVTEDVLLERVRKLAGSVEVAVPGRQYKTKNIFGQEVTKREWNRETVEVLPPSKMRMEPFWAVVLSTDTAPVLVRTPRVWLRPDVIRWRGKQPDGVVPPTTHMVPSVDPDLRRRIEGERGRWVPKPMPPHVLRPDAAPADDVPDHGQEERHDQEERSKPATDGEGTERSRAQDRAPDPTPAPEREQGRGTPPPLRRPEKPAPEQEPGASGSGLHPAPWDLPPKDSGDAEGSGYTLPRPPWEDDDSEDEGK